MGLQLYPFWIRLRVAVRFSVNEFSTPQKEYMRSADGAANRQQTRSLIGSMTSWRDSEPESSGPACCRSRTRQQ